MSIPDLRKGFLAPNRHYFDVDMAFYQERLKGFLPEKFIDIHGHISACEPASEPPTDWAVRVTNARGLRIEEYFDWQIKMFPGKDVRPLVFGHPRPERIEEENAYVAESLTKYGSDRLWGLLLESPYWSVQELEKRFKAGRFLGLKPYPTMPTRVPTKDVKIFDMLPHEHLEWANEHRLIVMLHVPRGDRRIADEFNLTQLEEINRRYPKLKLIIAHIGRAYTNTPDGHDAIKRLAQCTNLLWDFCANDCQPIMETLIKAVGPKRIMYGSDLPILAFRGQRLDVKGEYVNVIYQADWEDKRTRRPAAGDDQYTFFLYQQIDSFRKAAENCGLSRGDVEDVFYRNSAQLLGETAAALRW
ncbi:MAG: amidohydrolase family protein [Phycisphaeraceae bacterium]|nr:amidohydrolase family protein [Phycisphaeraceae bacterium]